MSEHKVASTYRRTRVDIVAYFGVAALVTNDATSVRELYR
jgi:hypothetical protein